MQKRSKRILASTLAVAGVLAVTGVAYAVYNTEKESSAIAAQSNIRNSSSPAPPPTRHCGPTKQPTSASRSRTQTTRR